MDQSTTPSLSQTIWPSWASRQFLTVHIVQTLLPVTFAYSLSPEATTKVIYTLTQEDFLMAFQKVLERYNKCIAAGEDYFEVDSDVCTMKKSGNLSYAPCTSIYELRQMEEGIKFDITSNLKWNSICLISDL